MAQPPKYRLTPTENGETSKLDKNRRVDMAADEGRDVGRQRLRGREDGAIMKEKQLRD